jgi:hypothetical protein
MSIESVCQVARSWVYLGSFHTRFVVKFMIFTASVRNILDLASYIDWHVRYYIVQYIITELTIVYS